MIINDGNGIGDSIEQRTIKAQEIKCWRCWEYMTHKHWAQRYAFADDPKRKLTNLHKVLCSVVYTSFLWVPNSIVTVREDYGLSDSLNGIHAYKARKGTDEWHCPWSDMTKMYPLVVGTVEIWGDVIEHERGYRATYARITSLDEVIFNHEQNDEILKEAQELYGVGFNDA